MANKSIQKSFNWYDDRESILTEILCGADQMFIEVCKEKGDEYLSSLDNTEIFINEVAALERTHTQSLIRAFWIVNLVYMHYYRKPKWKNLETYYVIRCAYHEKMMRMRKVKQMPSAS